MRHLTARNCRNPQRTLAILSTAAHFRMTLPAIVILLSVSGKTIADEESFERHVRPVLVDTCFRCHGGERTAGDLRVDSREALIRGGDSGPAFVESPEADPATLVRDSLLLQAIRREPDVSAMPPDHALSTEQIEAFEDWVSKGARWPQKPMEFSSRAHWSFVPVAKPSLPEEASDPWCQGDIDAFALEQIHSESQEPMPEADRRTLIRRIVYDVTGLPPTVERVESFVSDPRPTSELLAQLVDELLASPAYGEHWGRHWFDVVRYADTAGENSDHPLPHAWKYRNWVINALNNDLPFDQFVRRQLAGDIIARQAASLPVISSDEYADNVIATGYLAIARRFGHDIDKDIHLTYEDVIDNLGKNFLGLTLGCCRCHDHKYDPVSAEDYYALYGVFASTRFAFPGCEPHQQPRDLVPLLPETIARNRMAEWELLKSEMETASASLNQSVENLTVCLTESLSSSSTEIASGDLADGTAAPLSQQPVMLKVDQGQAIQISVFPKGNYGADSTRLSLTITQTDSADPQKQWSVADLIDDLLIANPHPGNKLTKPEDGTWALLDATEGIKLLRARQPAIDGHPELQAWNESTPSVFVNRSEVPVSVWTTLPPRTFFVHPGPNGPVSIVWLAPCDGTFQLSGEIADAHPGGDGVAWAIRHIQAPEFANQLRRLGQHMQQLDDVAAKLERDRPVIPVAYAVSDGTPTDSPIQLRGNPEEPGNVVGRRFPRILGGMPLSDSAGSGRLDLADAIVSRNNPLTARVFVNRVWQKYFGAGIVKTPNDFGTRGAPPSNQALLDYLASDFMENDWRIKRLHRQILLSAVYRQATSSADHAAALAGHARRRLSAEELRDTLLFVSAELDRSPGQQHPFPPESSWGFTQHTPFAAEYESSRRSVYLMQKRNRRDRFFALFDGADPNASTPVRDVTTAPTQALYLMNDPFVHRCSEKMAERLLKQHGSETACLKVASLQLYARPLSPHHESAWDQMIQQFPAQTDSEVLSRLATFIRIMLVSNEMMFVP
ncbi:MAG: PSD1 domain-containing protein [Planctomycetaceae bacterium]|nr:PSD1 domain-containing protein [Planctomycetaceae bacterium]